MNILIVSSFLPYPLHNGGSVRLYNLIKQISQKHQVTLICEKRPNQSDLDIKEVEKICDHVVTVARNRQWSIKNVLKTGFSSSPFLLVGHTSPAMKHAIKQELLQKKYDLIHIETFYVMQNLPTTLLPTVLVEHNIEYFIYERYAKMAQFFLRPLLMIDVEKLKRAEKQAWKKATVVATVSQQDKDVIGQKNTYVVPNGVDTTVFQPKNISSEFKSKEKKILYIGDYGYVQNKDAVSYIIKSIWPLIKQNDGVKKTLWIVGKNMTQSIKDLGKGDEGIIFDDTNIQTAAEIFTEADVLLAPIRIGGGTSYKIIEAMAVGTPVVTTTLGHEGIEANSDKEIIVADTPEAIAAAVVSLLTHEQQYRSLSQNARKAIEKNYDWEQIAKSLEHVYGEVTKV
jgi:glycosyltransferase involved in cell wall biosynthesis